MDHIAVSIVIEPFREETEDILTAELAEIGYSGFLSEKPLLKAYIPAADFRESHLRIILETYGITQYSKDFIANKNWSADWESRFEPIITRWRLVVKPELSFGTGHHPTTYMMLEALLELESEGILRNNHVLDLGCGTGVLAILAAKMGAALPVHALDNDRRAVHSCRENARRNRVAHKVNVLHGDASFIQSGRYGLIMANIHRNILISEMDTFARGLRPEPGHLLLSGFYTADVAHLTEAALRNGLTLFSQKEKEGWVLLHFIKSVNI